MSLDHLHCFIRQIAVVKMKTTASIADRDQYAQPDEDHSTLIVRYYLEWITIFLSTNTAHSRIIDCLIFYGKFINLPMRCSNSPDWYLHHRHKRFCLCRYIFALSFLYKKSSLYDLKDRENIRIGNRRLFHYRTRTRILYFSAPSCRISLDIFDKRTQSVQFFSAIALTRTNEKQNYCSQTDSHHQWLYHSQHILLDLFSAFRSNRKQLWSERRECTYIRLRVGLYTS